VLLDVWEHYFRASEEAPGLCEHILVSLWNVTERLVESGVFDVLNRAAPFRLCCSFHDDHTIVLRILDWPEP
jgi:hypothetical protein